MVGLRLFDDVREFLGPMTLSRIFMSYTGRIVAEGGSKLS